MTESNVCFYAMPDSPHLTWSACGYTLLTLTGLSPALTTDQIERLTLNGIGLVTRPMGDNTLMIIPAFKQEAQRMVIHLISDPAKEAAEPFISIRATPAPPDLSTGLTPPNNRYERHSR